MALQQFVNLSTWREDRVSIEPGKVHVLTFIDTKPNMFYVINPNDVKLRISIGGIPTHERYEVKIDENSTGTHGRPTQTGYLYILNDGTKNAEVTVYSVAKEFDMNVLKNLSLQAENVTLETDGICRGFAGDVELPAGNNILGKVGLTEEVLKSLANNENQSETNTLLSHLYNMFCNGTDNADMTYNLMTLLGDFKNIVTAGINETIVNKLESINSKLLDLNASMNGNSGISTYHIDVQFNYERFFHNEIANFEAAVDQNESMFIIDYLYNDSQSYMNLVLEKENKRTLFTLFPEEKIENITIYVGAGEKFKIECGENPMYRGKIRHYLKRA